MKKIIYTALLFAMLFTCGCGSGSDMKDGFYSAEMSDYSYGWKEYLCIMVKDDAIVYAEFNAKDPSGYIKAWDNAYMKNMALVSHTYPNEYTRAYVTQPLKAQNADDIDMVSGATQSGDNFKKLSSAVIEQAIQGDSSTVIVEATDTE